MQMLLLQRSRKAGGWGNDSELLQRVEDVASSILWHSETGTKKNPYWALQSAILPSWSASVNHMQILCSLYQFPKTLYIAAAPFGQKVLTSFCKELARRMPLLPGKQSPSHGLPSKGSDPASQVQKTERGIQKGWTEAISLTPGTWISTWGFAVLQDKKRSCFSSYILLTNA